MAYFDSDVECTKEQQIEFDKAIQKARVEDFSSYEKAEFLKILGSDAEGRKIVLFLPFFFNGFNFPMDKSVRFALKKLEDIFAQKFSVVVCLTQTSLIISSGIIYLQNIYQLLSRSNKKNLMKVYLVHSGINMKALSICATPIVSSRFLEKIEYAENLEYVIRKIRSPPLEVLNLFPYLIQREEEILLNKDVVSAFGCDMNTLSIRFGRDTNQFKKVPSMLIMLVEALSQPKVLETRDLLMMYPSAYSFYALVGDVEKGTPNPPIEDTAALSATFKLFLDAQPIPLLGKAAYEELESLSKSEVTDRTISNTLQKIIQKLTPRQVDCTKYLLSFFRLVAENSDQNSMTINRIATEFAATFFRPQNVNPTLIHSLQQTAEKLLMILITQEKNLFQDEESEEDEEEEEDEEDEESEEEFPEPTSVANKPQQTSQHFTKAKKEESSEEEEEEEEEEEDE